MRIAVFGAGTIGRLRGATVASAPDTELAAIVDTDFPKAQAAAADLGTQAAAEYGAALLDVRPDAVIVSSPIHLHEEMCLAAFEAGCHVLCEKPLSNTVESCQRIHAASVEHSRSLAVGFNHRYYPCIKYLKECLHDDRIGTLDHLRVFGGHDGLHNFSQDWMYKSPVSGGGAMMDVGIHMTDLVNHIGGDVVEVSAMSSGAVWNVDGSEDNAVAVMRTVRDVPVLYQATWTEWKGYRIYFEAYGANGMVRAYYAPMFNLLITQEQPGGRRKRTMKLYPEIILREKLKGWQSTTQGTFMEELRDFLQMIRGQPVPLADGDAGVRAVEVAHAVYESSRTRRTVKVRPA